MPLIASSNPPIADRMCPIVTRTCIGENPSHVFSNYFFNLHLPYDYKHLPAEFDPSRAFSNQVPSCHPVRL